MQAGSAVVLRSLSFILAAALCWTGCDVFVDTVDPGTFEAEATGIIEAKLQGRAYYTVYGSGAEQTVIFYFLTGSSELPGPDPAGYDPTGVFIRTRWQPGTEAAMRLPVEAVLHDRVVLEDGRRAYVVAGSFIITEIEDQRATGEFSLAAIEDPPTGWPPFAVGGTFDALPAPPF